MKTGTRITTTGDLIEWARNSNNKIVYVKDGTDSVLNWESHVQFISLGALIRMFQSGEFFRYEHPPRYVDKRFIPRFP